MQIQQDISLKPYNTFGIDVKAKQFIAITSIDELKQLLQKQKDFFVLGGGSNLLLTQDFDKLVVHIAFKGIEIVEENDNYVIVKASAGENWHQFVLWCISHDFGGVENMSLIPGNVGTAPIQNIGAYGVELKDTCTKVETIEIETGKTQTFTNDECEFGYRNSVFKNELKGKYIITNVFFKLTKNNHRLNSSYGAIRSELEKKGIKEPSIKNISDAVIAIRQSKLPDPKELGNSGSFFKNPVISTTEFKKLQENFPDAPHYNVSETEIKVPAGWLVEQCGFKGKRIGNTGSHKNQALVLVNYGNASGKEVYELSKLIQKTVFDKFGIAIEAEVNII
ncbi:UDP-N-acetylmuramate dehydrogenase [Aureibaculum sp. 2210JD6-5]|uniref:UDP-N-acetylmuramate dehydrogenase n=1 Tax=Aureibaculum sp. 2210JD6-5 TaxID=3103957 RepID=UPI002AAE08DA|nr:UDP-N-acetylmuramate dehydrogenase [Aureibaculum sp. 2210JD6-5]MDY7393710.1 UDP-N-acetylmuramate dehydrogenase [Aureibaculum sp. 2210JD6-5]